MLAEGQFTNVRRGKEPEASAEIVIENGKIAIMLRHETKVECQKISSAVTEN